jgi:hypothetical protein
MSSLKINELLVYRWRYWLGYLFVGLALIGILVFAGLYLPGGISNQEIQSVITSDSIDYSNLDTLAIPNLPYHVLQKLSLDILGASIFSIKLPSIILSFLSIVGMIILLQRWFKPRIGILASVIAITTGQFIFIAQDGTAGIMYLFWSVWLILLADLIARYRKFRTLLAILFCILAVLSLYTPLSIYIMVALSISIILHPHLRYLIRQASRPRLLIGATFTALLFISLGMAIYKSPNLGIELLGVPSVWPNIGENISLLGAQYFGFSHPGETNLLTPFFELGSMIIIAIGIYNVYRNRAAVKSYIITIWILCLVPLIILSPEYTSITFLPLVLLLASGIGALLSYWYTLFPRNPYARIVGLVPIVVLVTVLLLSGVDRYMYAYRYDPSIVHSFSNDLRLIPQNTDNIVVADEEIEFYNIIAKHNNITVSSSPISNSFLATRMAHKDYDGYDITNIITSCRAEQGDRFYLYKKTEK